MTKEELDRIKKAYSSGLKVQIWFNGYWEDFDIRDYSMYSEPFSEHRQYRIVGSDYADIAEEQIADLEKENAELKEKLNFSTQYYQGEKAKDQLTKAKEILRDLIKFQPYIDKEAMFLSVGNEWKTVIYKAKQFLEKESE